MAHYDSNVKVQLVDPINHTNKRSEFLLPVGDHMYFSNLRLLNVGCTLSQVGQDVLYNGLTGSLSCIKSIFLYDGRTVLDSVIDFQNIVSFLNYKSTNMKSSQINKPLLHHSLGFIYAQDVGLNAIIREDYKDINKTPTTNADTTPLCHIDLTLILPMLSAIGSLDTTMFKNLRLVLEYDTKNAVVEENDVNTITVASVVQPLLVVDELVNMMAVQQIRKDFKGVVWNAYENEKVNVPEHPETSTTQQLTYKLSGLASNKNLGRVFIQKSSTAYTITDNYLFLSNGSLAMWNEKVNVLCNGVQLLPYDGISRPNERLALLDMTFGNCNSISTCNSGSIWQSDDKIQSVQNFCGTLDYIGLNIGRRCNELVVNYSRDFFDESSVIYKLPLTLNIVAEVSKSLVMTGKGYQVLYT
jgi:hypothetical protein